MPEMSVQGVKKGYSQQDRHFHFAVNTNHPLSSKDKDATRDKSDNVQVPSNLNFQMGERRSFPSIVVHSVQGENKFVNNSTIICSGEQ